MNRPMVERCKSNSLPSRTDLHLSRKLWHMVPGTSLLYLYYKNPHIEYKTWGQFILTLSLCSFIVEFLRLRFPAINAPILKIFSPFLRDEEKQSLSGLPFYSLGCAVSIFAFEERIGILSILFLIFSDPISSLFGILYGKDKIFGGKSLQGSLAGFGVCYLIALIYALAYHEAGLPLFFFALLAGIIGSLSELLSVFIDDNFSIPVFSGLGITLLNKIFHIF